MDISLLNRVVFFRRKSKMHAIFQLWIHKFKVITQLFTGQITPHYLSSWTPTEAIKLKQAFTRNKLLVHPSACNPVELFTNHSGSWPGITKMLNISHMEKLQFTGNKKKKFSLDPSTFSVMEVLSRVTPAILKPLPGCKSGLTPLLCRVVSKLFGLSLIHKKA